MEYSEVNAVHWCFASHPLLNTHTLSLYILLLLPPPSPPLSVQLIGFYYENDPRSEINSFATRSEVIFVTKEELATSPGAAELRPAQIKAITERYLSDKADPATAEKPILTLEPGASPNDLAREAISKLYQ